MRNPRNWMRRQGRRSASAGFCARRARFGVCHEGRLPVAKKLHHHRRRPGKATAPARGSGKRIVVRGKAVLGNQTKLSSTIRRVMSRSPRAFIEPPDGQTRDRRLRDTRGRNPPTRAPNIGPGEVAAVGLVKDDMGQRPVFPLVVEERLDLGPGVRIV